MDELVTPGYSEYTTRLLAALQADRKTSNIVERAVNRAARAYRDEHRNVREAVAAVAKTVLADLPAPEREAAIDIFTRASMAAATKPEGRIRKL